MKQDATYQDASIRAAARFMSELWRGLLEEGMPEEVALKIILEWVRTVLASAKSE